MNPSFNTQCNIIFKRKQVLPTTLRLHKKSEYESVKLLLPAPSSSLSLFFFSKYYKNNTLYRYAFVFVVVPRRQGSPKVVLQCRARYSTRHEVMNQL